MPSRKHFMFIEIAVTDQILDHLNGMPITARRAALERAIHRALDHEGWPTGDRGTIAIPADWWYVTIWKPNYAIKGHVGPIVDVDAAKTAVRSWSRAGFIAELGRVPQGPPLTNSHYEGR